MCVEALQLVDFPIPGILLNVYRIEKLKKASKLSERAVEPIR
jgi:hypothetical protein